MGLVVCVSLASCAWLTRPAPPSPMGSAWPYATPSPSGEGPPQHVITAARENMSTSTGGPACLDAMPSGPSARQRCATAAPGGPRMVCRAACVRSHLPDEAERARAGGLVAVRYTLDAQGAVERATALNNPGCGLGPAAPDALRVCCDLVSDGATAAQRAGVEGCHVIEFTIAR